MDQEKGRADDVLEETHSCFYYSSGCVGELVAMKTSSSYNIRRGSFDGFETKIPCKDGTRYLPTVGLVYVEAGQWEWRAGEIEAALEPP